MLAIPVPDGQATLTVRSGDDTLRGGNPKDSNGKSNRSKGGQIRKSSKGGKGKSNGKSTSKSKGDNLKQRLVSRTKCRLCIEGGHLEELCPQADVHVTFSRPLVGVGVSQAWGDETCTVSQ